MLEYHMSYDCELMYNIEILVHNVVKNVVKNSDHSHTAHFIRMPQSYTVDVCSVRSPRIWNLSVS